MNNLTRVTNARVTRSAARSIERQFKLHGERFKSYIGFPGGSQFVSGYWVADAGIWLCPPSDWGADLNRYWFGYGTVPPGEIPNLPIAVEINFPREGMNRRVKGLLASDASGKILICHSGKLGGRLGTGTYEAFSQFWGQPTVAVVDEDGNSSDVFAIAELGSDRIITHIAEFVHACAAFKAGNSKSDNFRRSQIFEGASYEFEGEKTIGSRPGYTASCDHGIVRNRLDSLLAASGHKVGRDQSRDLFVGNPKNPEAEFEIKTSCDPQSIYTAVGQLIVHGVRTPPKNCVAVLPHPVPDSVVKTLKKLGIHIVRYRWTKSRIHYDGLNTLYPGVDSVAPINPRR